MSHETSPTDSSPSRDTVTLQVCERRFITTRDTLVAESDFFASALSEQSSIAQENGCYFVDSDANLFEWILRYLRRGVFPLFYDESKGHDYAAYVALLEEAKYFRIQRLEQWLENQRYLDAVRTVYSVTEVEDINELSRSQLSNSELEFYPNRFIRKVYICPRGIHVHRGKPGACGRDCRRAQGDADNEYEEEPVLSTLVVEKTTVFDMQVCLAVVADTDTDTGAGAGVRIP